MLYYFDNFINNYHGFNNLVRNCNLVYFIESLEIDYLNDYNYFHS
jgi:hypothetical protein